MAPIFPQALIAFNRLRSGLSDWTLRTRILESPPQITLPNGARIVFKSGEKPDGLYGEDVYAAVLDEATRMRPAVWAAIRSTLTYTRGPIRIIGNVKGNRNWVYKLGQRAKQEMEAGNDRWHYARITAVDAQAAHVLDPAEVEDARSVLTTEDFQELYMAEPASTLGFIYAQFSQHNVSDDAVFIPGAGPLFLFGDWGFTDNTAILFAQMRDGRLYVFDELVGNGVAEGEWVRRVVRRLIDLDGYDGPPWEEWLRIWADQARPAHWPTVWPEAAISDPSAGQLRTTFATHGISASLPKRVKHEVIAGQRKLNALFEADAGNRRLFIHPSCSETINGLGAYVAKQREDGSFEERPDPGAENHTWSHPCDALRYGAWGLRRFFDIQSGQVPAELPPEDDA